MPVAKIKDFTPADLRRIAKAMEGYSVELHQLADGMDAEKIERMPIKGVGELERAEERIGVFCDNGRTSLRRVTRPMMFGQEKEFVPQRLS